MSGFPEDFGASVDVVGRVKTSELHMAMVDSRVSSEYINL